MTVHDARGCGLGRAHQPAGRRQARHDLPPGTVRLVLAPVLFTRGAYSVTVAALDERIRRDFDPRGQATRFTVDGPGVSTHEVSGHAVSPHWWEAGPAAD